MLLTLDAPKILISPVREISAYETLWTRYSSVPKLAALFKRFNHALPSEVALSEGITDEEISTVKDVIRDLLPFNRFGALFYGDLEYPGKLRAAKNPIEVLYYQGRLDVLSSRAVSVVGTRNPSDEGRRRARKIARLLVDNEFTVMSGLAKGIDTEAHKAALEFGGRTVGVIGTSLNNNYPKENRELQLSIARHFLIVSQVPFYQSSKWDYRHNRGFFPERNKTMSALSEATIIVEASDTSGTLIQARAAFNQGKKLFILDSCFDKGLTWPERFLRKGAIRIEDGTEILEHLGKNDRSRLEMA